MTKIKHQDTLPSLKTGESFLLRGGRLALLARDFRLILIAGVLLMLLIAFDSWLWFLAPLRAILGLLFVLYIPGYVLATVLFPRQDELDSIERIGLSLGLSLAVVSILALLLDRLPWGIRLWPILLGEYGVTIVCMSFALWRRTRLAVDVVYAPRPVWQPRRWWQPLPRFEKRIYTLLASILLFAGLVTAWVFLVPSDNEFLTEYYILGKDGMAEDYPREATLSETITVTFGIINRERDAKIYRVEVWAIDPWEADRRTQVAQAGPITLGVNQEYESPLSWQMPWVGDDQQIEFYLYTEGQVEPYRQLRLWLNVVEDSTRGVYGVVTPKEHRLNLLEPSPTVPFIATRSSVPPTVRDTTRATDTRAMATLAIVSPVRDQIAIVPSTVIATYRVSSPPPTVSRPPVPVKSAAPTPRHSPTQETSANTATTVLSQVDVTEQILESEFLWLDKLEGYIPFTESVETGLL